MQTLSDKLAEIDRRLSDSDIYTDQNKQELKELLLKKAELDKAHEAAESGWLECNEELDSITS